MYKEETMEEVTIEELAKRVTNLERNFSALINTININKGYTDADLNGVRAGVSNITPYTETKEAYIGDTEVIFNTDVSGNLTVYVTDSEGNIPSYTVTKSTGYIRVAFDNPLERPAKVTISIQEG